jgi:hypothetical protein
MYILKKTQHQTKRQFSPQEVPNGFVILLHVYGDHSPKLGLS